ncbi:MAG: isoprenylcysteine carboxylmethyltransferase family protein [Candidatus Thorarchaeota archaeon]
MSRKQHVFAILALPTMVTIIIPILLVYMTQPLIIGWLLSYPFNLLPTTAGLVVAIVGLITLIQTNRHFASTGEGTLAPWAPTSKLVVHGVYLYVRNPMILGVLMILLGESIFIGSYAIFLWFLFFAIGNHMYFIKSEEPGLIARFGDDYLRYLENVPRWIPRRTPWNPHEHVD